jgi:hypothetical protein
LEAFVVRGLADYFRRSYSQRKMCGKCVHPFLCRKYRNDRRNESVNKEIEMKPATIRKMQSFLLVALIAATTPAMLAQRKAQTKPQPAAQQAPQAAASQTQAAPGAVAAPGAAAAPVSLCANRPLCYEANDFVATVSEFRTSSDAYGNKVLDAMMHFQNKTNQPISLGYVESSGSAVDDMGNRFALNTNNGGVRGMGVVNGTVMDPKFTLPGGGGGDARFELYWPPRGKLAGVNYEMELSIREMTRVEGNQWSLGDETLVHYQGLANGVGVAAVSVPAGGMGSSGMAPSGMATNGMAANPASNMGTTVNNYASPQASVAQPASQQVTAYAAAGQPCPAGTAPASAVGKAQNAATSAGVQNQTANNAVGNATSAISSLGSIFGRKKNAQPAANQTAGATPCVATANGMNSNPSATPAVTPVAARAIVPATSATPVANPNQVVNTKVAAVPVNPGVRTQPTATPRTAVTNATLKRPIPAAKPAVKAPARTVPPAKKPTTTTATTTTTGG